MKKLFCLNGKLCCDVISILKHIHISSQIFLSKFLSQLNFIRSKKLIILSFYYNYIVVINGNLHFNNLIRNFMVSVSIFRLLLNVLYTFTEFQIFRSREELFTQWINK